jgi:hypothetical protein
MKMISLLCAVALVEAILGEEPVSAAESQKNSDLTLVVKRIKVFGHRTEFDLEVKSNLGFAVRVSEFSLAGAIRAIKLTDGEGTEWQIERPKVVEDPPAQDVDFSFHLNPRGTNRIKLATPPLSNGISDKAGAGSKRPTVIQFKISRSVAAMERKSGKFRNLTGAGSGIADIEWQKP